MCFLFDFWILTLILFVDQHNWGRSFTVLDQCLILLVLLSYSCSTSSASLYYITNYCLEFLAAIAGFFWSWLWAIAADAVRCWWCCCWWVKDRSPVYIKIAFYFDDRMLSPKPAESAPLAFLGVLLNLASWRVISSRSASELSSYFLREMQSQQFLPWAV